MVVARVGLDDADALALIAELNRELADRYPEDGALHVRLEPDEVGPGRGALLIARDGDAAFACGAVRLIAPGVAELKRMYTRPEARGRGLGRMLLAALEGVARELGATQLVLETGARQPEAIALYEQAGFAPIPPFGDYAGSPLSVCMGKRLA